MLKTGKILTRVSRSLDFQITKIVAIFERKKKKTFDYSLHVLISIRPTTNMTNQQHFVKSEIVWKFFWAW